MSAPVDIGQGCGDACSEVLNRLEAYLDGELPDADLGELREHLAECYPCTDRASFEEQLRAIVRRECTDQAPPRLIERIEHALQEGVSPDV